MEEIEIIRIFSREFNRELTINQIAGLIGKSYSFTNRLVHGMLKRQVLKQKKVGMAILCSLNFENEETIGLLVLNSIYATQEYVIRQSQPRQGQLAKAVNVLDSPLVQSAYLADSEIVIISSDRELTTELKAKIIAPGELNVRKLPFDRIIVLKNHENFWRMVKKHS